jgi:hypothetical protein
MSRRIWGPIAGFKRALMSAAWSMCGDLGVDGDRRYTVQHDIDELTSVNGASG